MLELRGISKYFPSNGVSALVNANLKVLPGEIHALLGENGTGKSTLMHITAGYFPPSAGTILLDGKERRFTAPSDALALGIGMVRQHPGFIRGFKVWEDCVLGAESRRSLFFDPVSARKRVIELSVRWGFDLPLDAPSETLSVSRRQKAAVLALLLREVKLFIFDEPTAVLAPEETKKIFELLRRLRSGGKGVILITHKLDEALALSDRITVIRKGATQETRAAKELSPKLLEDAIFGGDAVKPAASVMQDARRSPEERPVLEISGFQAEAPGLPRLRNVSLRLFSGKILGIAGVRDGGLETLELAVTGLLPRAGKGSITLNGRDINGKGARAFREAGGAYLGADRLGGGLAPNLPIKESLVIHAFRRMRRGFGIFLDTRRLDSWCRNIMNRAGIARSVNDSAASFSGGMLQRILLAREFAEEVSLLVLAEAGSGLDGINRRKLGEELKAAARNGSAVLLFSADTAELIPIADEIMTLGNGTLAGAETGGGNET